MSVKHDVTITKGIHQRLAECACGEWTILSKSEGYLAQWQKRHEAVTLDLTDKVFLGGVRLHRKNTLAERVAEARQRRTA